MRTQSVDTSPEVERVLIGLIREAPLSKRFELVRSLTAFTVRLNKQNIRELYPSATAQQVAEQFVLDHYGSALANGLRLAAQKTNICFSDAPSIIDVITSITTFFEQLCVPYCLVGTLGASLYGMQRATFSIDFIANIPSEQVARLLNEAAPLYYFEEDIVGASATFVGLHLPSLLKVNIHTCQLDTFTTRVYRRAKTYSLVQEGKAFSIASPEDILLTQLMEYQKSGEVADDQWNEILGVLKVQDECLALDYLKQWSTIFTVDGLLYKAFEDAGTDITTKKTLCM